MERGSNDTFSQIPPPFMSQYGGCVLLLLVRSDVPLGPLAPAGSRSGSGRSRSSCGLGGAAPLILAVLPFLQIQSTLFPAGEKNDKVRVGDPPSQGDKFYLGAAFHC